MTITTINPTTGQQIATYPFHTADEFDAALTGAATAQAAWREVPRIATPAAAALGVAR